ncbi:hypothetical protein HPB48_022444 [Haemaphysalis longicornis]|uniref:Fibronectin type-III domain-containing protein n=1 Tax=Haemaphysalis longicornis TaxID=44386 RepID=A0A9J6FUT7_HAELO|nr:hypothetical protein HPB48_022444 [Haemaphysalis longicornis]
MWDQKHRNRTTTASSFTYNDLVPYTRYRVKVFAQNDAGRFPHFSPLDFITAPEGETYSHIVRTSNTFSTFS